MPSLWSHLLQLRHAPHTHISILVKETRCLLPALYRELSEKDSPFLTAIKRVSAQYQEIVEGCEKAVYGEVCCTCQEDFVAGAHWPTTRSQLELEAEYQAEFTHVRRANATKGNNDHCHCHFLLLLSPPPPLLCFLDAPATPLDARALAHITLCYFLLSKRQWERGKN